MADERRSNRKPSGQGGRPGDGRGGSSGRSGGPGSSPARDQRRGSSEGGPRRGSSEGGPRRGSSSESGGQRWGGSAAGDGKPRSGGSAAGGGRPRSGARSGAPVGKRPTGDRKPYQKRVPEPKPERTVDQTAYDGPDLPEDITGKELDRSIAAQLRGLPEKLAARIARHLVAAAMYIDDNPELAYQHAKAAKARTQRIAVIREALGEAAYAAGHYAEALSELRAAKRMNGATAYLPIMADCHRALGQPEQAIKLAQSPSVRNFEPEAKAEMTIVEAGARRDLKQYDAALRTLELAPLQSKTRASWVVRLRYAYADTLEEAGRANDALMWFHRTHAVDADELTDAAARAEALERRIAD